MNWVLFNNIVHSALQQTYALILRSKIKITSKLIGVPSDIAFFISLRCYYEEPSRAHKEWECIYLFIVSFGIIIRDCASNQKVKLRVFITPEFNFEPLSSGKKTKLKYRRGQHYQ